VQEGELPGWGYGSGRLFSADSDTFQARAHESQNKPRIVSDSFDLAGHTNRGQRAKRKIYAFGCTSRNYFDRFGCLCSGSTRVESGGIRMRSTSTSYMRRHVGTKNKR